MNRRASRLSLALLPVALALVFHRLLLGEVFFWGLPALQFVPWRDYAFDLVRQGHLPLWNPFNGAGAPLFANYQSALLYPPNWLGYVLPLAQAMSLVAVAHLFLAGWGMWLFTGRLGASSSGRGASAFAFGMGNYLVARLGTYPIITTAAWLPLLLWAAHGVLATGRRRDAAWLALFAGLMLLAGHAQTAWYSLALVGVFGAWWLIVSPPLTPPPQGGRGIKTEANPIPHPPPRPTGISFGHKWRGGEKARRFAALAAALALGAGIAALQLLATAELLGASPRSDGVDYEFAMNFSYEPTRIFNLLSPNVFGNPGDGSYSVGGYSFEYAVYVGIIPLIAAFAALAGWLQNRRNPERRALFATVPLWGLVVVAAFVLALGKYSPVFPFLYEHVPTFDLFQAPVRWHLWTVFGLSVLAGIGASAWGRGYRLRRWTRRALVACAGLVVTAGVLLLATPSLQRGGALLLRGLMTAGVFGALACWLTLRQPEAGSPRYGRWAALVMLLIAADLALASWGLNPTVPAAFFDRRADAATTARLYYPAAALDRLQYTIYFPPKDYRYATQHWGQLRTSLMPNLNLLDRIPMLNNFDPLRIGHFDAYQTLVEESGLAQPLLQAAGVGEVLPNGRRRVPAARAWFVGSVCWHTSEESLRNALLDPAWNPYRQLHMLGDAGCPDAPPEDDTLPEPILFNDEGGRITLDARAPYDGWLALADTDYPGWTATVDNVPVPIYRANLAFRAVQVPPGAHTVVFEYHPAWLLPGALASLIALLVTLALFRLKDIPSSGKDMGYNDKDRA